MRHRRSPVTRVDSLGGFIYSYVCESRRIRPIVTRQSPAFPEASGGRGGVTGCARVLRPLFFGLEGRPYIARGGCAERREQKDERRAEEEERGRSTMPPSSTLGRLRSRFAAEPREYGRPHVRGRVQDNDSHRRSSSPQRPEADLVDVRHRGCCYGGWLGSDCRRTTDHCLWPPSAVRPQQASLGNGRRAGGDLPVRFTRTFRPKPRQIDPSHPADFPSALQSPHSEVYTTLAIARKRVMGAPDIHTGRSTG
jgi:hypothetical protein